MSEGNPRNNSHGVRQVSLMGVVSSRCPEGLVRQISFSLE